MDETEYDFGEPYFVGVMEEDSTSWTRCAVFHRVVVDEVLRETGECATREDAIELGYAFVGYETLAFLLTGWTSSHPAAAGHPFRGPASIDVGSHYVTVTQWGGLDV